MGISYYAEDGLYNYSHSKSIRPELSLFQLHSHKDMCEIIVFIKGNCEFSVEGSIYKPKPFDVLVTHSTEMHEMKHKEPLAEYERCVFHICNSFFTKNNCENFKKIFVGRRIGANNLISPVSSEQAHIINIVNDVDYYLTSDKNVPEIIITSKLLELLYNLNCMSKTVYVSGKDNEQIKDILLFINENITSNLSLDTLADTFHINKYHLCHIFKQHTGLTLNKYISYKRILLVRELHSQGKNLLEASIDAGFSNYSSFYKTYKKETGKSPKADMNF